MHKYRWRAPLLRIAKYGGIDLGLFPLNLLTAWLLTEAGLDYKYATVVGFFLQITVGFFLNRRWTFDTQVRTGTGLITTWFIGASDLVIALAATVALVELAGFGFLIARTGAAVVVFVWDYALNSWITFRTKPLA